MPSHLYYTVTEMSILKTTQPLAINNTNAITHMHAGTAMDNPTYNEGCQETPTLNNLTLNDEYEKEFKNPIYSDESDIGHNPASDTNSQLLQNTTHYEGAYFESKAVNENLSENTDSGVAPGAHTNGASSHMANDGVIMKGAVSEGVYDHELPPLNLNEAAADDENCYSTLDPTYSQLEPHLRDPKPGVEINCPPNNDDYSHLKYK